MSILSDPKFFPTCMIVLSGMAAISYAVQGDFRHALYWISATVITVTVTY